MKIGESTNSVVAKLVREELLKSMGSLSTSISTHLARQFFLFFLDRITIRLRVRVRVRPF